MQETYTYHIEVQGQVDENDLNKSSPLRVLIARADVETTILTLHADQSGLVGLVRHLHHQGFAILSLSRA